MAQCQGFMAVNRLRLRTSLFTITIPPDWSLICCKHIYTCASVYSKHIFTFVIDFDSIYIIAM